MKYKYQTQFNRLPVNNIFLLNGNLYRKRSSRTAEIIDPVEYQGTWFYFGQSDYIRVSDKQVNLLK